MVNLSYYKETLCNKIVGAKVTVGAVGEEGEAAGRVEEWLARKACQEEFPLVVI